MLTMAPNLFAKERNMLFASKRFGYIQRVTEVTANLTIIAAVVVGATIWLRRPHPAAPLHDTNVAGAVSQYPNVGTRITLAGIDWSAHKTTLVVAISSACHYCVASTPFYNKITHSNNVVPIVVVMPQKEQDAQTFLQHYGITPSHTVSADLANIDVSATPTLLLVSSSGIVTKAWVGELTTVEQLDVSKWIART